MNTTPHTRIACAMMACATTLAMTVGLNTASACSWLYGATIIWPQDGATDVPPQTRVFLDVTGSVTARLIHTETGDAILWGGVSQYPNTGPFSIPRAYNVYTPGTLNPATTYTLQVTHDAVDITYEATFTTASDDTLPPPPSIDALRYYRAHYPSFEDIHPGQTACARSYNTVRFLRLNTTATHPVLYTLQGANALDSGPTQYTTEQAPIEDPCLALNWMDVFGRTGTTESICAPDACLDPDNPPPFNAPWDLDDYYKPEHCNPSNAQADADQDAGCATAPHHPSPTLPPLALIAFAWIARRARHPRTRP